MVAVPDECRGMKGSLGSEEGQGWGDVSVGRGLRSGAADVSRVGVHTFVSCMLGECPTQLSSVESLLFSGEVFAGFLSQRKKCLAALLAKITRVARICYFILGTSVLLGVAPPLRGLLI